LFISHWEGLAAADLFTVEAWTLMGLQEEPVRPTAFPEFREEFFGNFVWPIPLYTLKIGNRHHVCRTAAHEH